MIEESRVVQKAFETVMVQLISGLVNEFASTIQLNENELTAVIPSLDASNNCSNEIHAQAVRNPFTKDILIVNVNKIFINRDPLKKVDDLLKLGFNEKQFKLLKANLAATVYLERIYEESRYKRPQLLEIFEQLIGIKIDTLNVKNPGALAELLSFLPQREAFILSDTCGNVDGSNGNPLKNVLIGEDSNLIEYHPISVAFEQGTSNLLLVPYETARIKTLGRISDRLQSDFSYLNEGLIPMNSYSFQLIKAIESERTSVDALKTFTLLSKRSFIPLHGDYQIKTSFPAQITSEMRTIDWITMHDVLYSSRIVEQLAKKKLLPDQFWVQLTVFGSQANEDDRTTFYIREGLQDAISNNSNRGIPKEFTPITACALTNRNIITPDKTLLESMIEFGFDGIELFKKISRAIIHAQLHLIKIGWIPDCHTQNMIYLFDFNKKTFGGLLQRDSECEKINLEKLRSYHVDIEPKSPLNFKLLRTLENDDDKPLTLYLHHTVYTKHIVPIAMILNEKYNIHSNVLCDHVKECLIEWQNQNVDYDIRKDIDLSGRYYERNLACKTLGIGEPPHYRIISNHPLL